MSLLSRVYSWQYESRIRLAGILRSLRPVNGAGDSRSAFAAYCGSVSRRCREHAGDYSRTEVIYGAHPSCRNCNADWCIQAPCLSTGAIPAAAIIERVQMLLQREADEMTQAGAQNKSMGE